MNKSAGVLLGIVVAIGAISAGGAWYTGTQLEGVLNASVADTNKELESALVGSNGKASLELVSLERHVFSSTAHFRLKGEGQLFGDAPIELLFVDHIEHGPLPASRLFSLKWLPVMATLHYELEKTPLTEKWFAAAKDVSPLKGLVNIGYDKATNGNVELVPLELALNDKVSLKFSGLNLEVSATAQAQKLKASGYMNSLKLTAVSENQAPIQIELNGLTLASNLSKSPYGYYTGENTVELTDSKTTFGAKQSVVGIKNFEMKSQTEESGTNASGRADYKMGEMSLNGKAVGSAQLAMSAKNLDIPSSMSLMQIYQTKLQPYEKAVTKAAAAHLPAPELNLTPAEQAQIKAGLEKLLAAGPQLALENLSFTTPNGESRANLVLDLTKPTSMDLSPDQLVRQVIALLDINLQVSKPMLVDVLSAQAQAQAQAGGQTDAKAIADQAKATSDMFSAMAVGTQLAKLDGNNVVSKLHYANNQVEFNGQKMTVEQFVGFVMGKLGGAGAIQ
ncbi:MULTISPECIES: YdgA family protein [unclassified Pseudomonas]|uniref:YdgA family protein n=1 Tax=unclassified Pseudomonas TaxID=196821 RepID=UPI002AC9AD78|nr:MULTISPECIES: YdgA family protein [unclassified Pseudomonas]MEB0047953.1 YdgA family protein [Pseudomonas sp. Dout3]MEB0098854.1 YdgA family protein [Pseudomonas sp. DC1.2]WPX59120.1 YdgA family protein [Pseudomonas sp. DC1.2]